ncbi:hypothetical protein DFH06DRAFT_1344571 [Mycena polygramma]|nr:hypothetical protein DFH06DRAFT_1344571 [Mycena polygramma]
MKLCSTISGEKLKANALSLSEQNILRYDITVKKPGLTFATDIGLKESKFGLVVLVEAASRQKIRAVLSPIF